MQRFIQHINHIELSSEINLQPVYLFQYGEEMHLIEMSFATHNAAAFWVTSNDEFRMENLIDLEVNEVNISDIK